MLPPEVPPVAVYAGDTCIFPVYTFKESNIATNLVLAGWTSWVCSWRRKISAVEFIPVTVDAGQADLGIIQLLLSPEQTRAMGGAGVWDLQATRRLEIRTFLRGSTTYLKDVTHD